MCFPLFIFPPVRSFFNIATLWITGFFYLISCSSPAFGDIRINELYYDHPGTDAGHEFIELINTDSLAASLFGNAIEFHNGAGSGWESIWQAGPFDTIPAGGLFLIGGQQVFPPPDAVLDLHLQNGPDAVRFVNSTATLDLVGYGDLEDPDYVEGESAPGVDPGRSLSRIPDGKDTDHNREDFLPADPTPGRFNVPRRDVSLALLDEDERTAIVEAGFHEEIQFVLVNQGTEPVAPREVAVQLWDSTGAVELVGQILNTESIRPESVVEMAFRVSLSSGYHFLLLHADYPSDEREKNNDLELIRRAGTPPVLISEVLSYPNGSCPQYIELYNAGLETYDMTGHFLRDKTHAFSCISSVPVVLGPGVCLVLTSDKEALLLYFPMISPLDVVEVEGAWPYLNHSGSKGLADSVILGDKFQLPLNAVCYPPQSSSTKGTSLERVDLFPGSRAPIWVLSRDPCGGSPGRRNAASLYVRPGEKAVSLSPNPFSPWEGEKLLIAVDPKRDVAQAVVSIFDMNGRRIKTIGSSTIYPYVFIWDGTGEGNRTVSSGLYILACEFYSAEGGRLSVEKVVVGCGRKRR